MPKNHLREGRLKIKFQVPTLTWEGWSTCCEKRCPSYVAVSGAIAVTADWRQLSGHVLGTCVSAPEAPCQRLGHLPARGMTGSPGLTVVKCSGEAVRKRWGSSWTLTDGKDLQWGNGYSMDYLPNGTLSKAGTLNKPVTIEIWWGIEGY